MLDEEIAAGRAAAMLRRQHLRDESNPFEVSDQQFRKYYRMPQGLALQLIMILVERAGLPIYDHGVPPHLQILSTLRFLASGCYQATLGHDYNHAMSQSTISKYIHRVIAAIITLQGEYIKFPENEVQRQEAKVRFIILCPTIYKKFSLLSTYITVLVKTALMHMFKKELLSMFLQHLTTEIKKENLIFCFNLISHQEVVNDGRLD